MYRSRSILKIVLSSVDPLGYRLTAGVLRGGDAAAGCSLRVFAGAGIPANQILLASSPTAPLTLRQVCCNIFSPIQRPTLYYCPMMLY
jgi:hypothetical protein